jgi:hypothetical protein
MGKSVLVAIILTLALSILTLPAFSQAIAESVMLGAGASTAAGKAGSALSSALNRSSKQLAGRVQQQVSQPSQGSMPESGRELLPKSQGGSNTVAHSTPQSGALTLSIQGAKPNCESASKQGKAGTNCISPNASAKPESQKYKSVVTLSFPK